MQLLCGSLHHRVLPLSALHLYAYKEGLNKSLVSDLRMNNNREWDEGRKETSEISQPTFLPKHPDALGLTPLVMGWPHPPKAAHPFFLY